MKLVDIYKNIISEASVTDYYKNTHGVWEGLSRNEVNEFMDAYFQWRRKRNKPEFIEVGGKRYTVDHESQNKHAFFKSRGFSFYFIELGSDTIVRISDHWSDTGDRFKRSRKLNCAMIASCYWSLDGGDRVDVFIPGERYSSVMMGGKISASKLEPLNKWQ